MFSTVGDLDCIKWISSRLRKFRSSGFSLKQFRVFRSHEFKKYTWKLLSFEQNLQIKLNIIHPSLRENKLQCRYVVLGRYVWLHSLQELEENNWHAENMNVLHAAVMMHGIWNQLENKTEVINIFVKTFISDSLLSATLQAFMTGICLEQAPSLQNTLFYSGVC